MLPKRMEARNEGVCCVADSWATSLGLSPRRRPNRDDRWLGETSEESSPRWQSWDLLRHLRSQGGRYIPNVVLLATQEKHRAGREQGWRQMEHAGDRPRPEQKDRLGERSEPAGRHQEWRPLSNVVHRAGTRKIVDRLCHEQGRRDLGTNERQASAVSRKTVGKSGGDVSTCHL